jgi:integrase
MAVLAECPFCHTKQSVRNKLCKCGGVLVKLKRSDKVQYWITYRLRGGKQKFEKISGEQATSLDYAKDAEAKRKVQKRENRIFEIKAEAKMTFQELTDWYIDLESVKAKKYFWVLSLSLKKFNSQFGNVMVYDIKPSDLENYQAKRKSQGKAESTIDQEIGAAKAVINKAFKDDMVGGDVLKRFQGIKKLLKRNSNSRKRILTPDEFNQLVDSSTRHLKAILWTGYLTGMREGEILGLTERKVFLRDRITRLSAEDTKDGEAREIPICEDLHGVLSRLPRGIHEDYPIFSWGGKRMKGIQAGLSKACERVGIAYGRFIEGGFIFHDLRRTFVTDMRRAGVPESVIKEIMGHARREVIDGYNQVSMEDMRQAVERLVQYRQNQSASVYQTVYQVASGHQKRVSQVSANPLN